MCVGERERKREMILWEKNGGFQRAKTRPWTATLDERKMMGKGQSGFVHKHSAADAGVGGDE